MKKKFRLINFNEENCKGTEISSSNDIRQNFVGFELLNEHTLQLVFGDAVFKLNRNGEILLKNSRSNLVLTENGCVEIKTDNSIQLSADKRIDLN